MGTSYKLYINNDYLLSQKEKPRLIIVLKPQEKKYLKDVIVNTLSIYLEQKLQH